MKVTKTFKSNLSMPQQSPVNLVKSESYHVKTPRGFFKLDYKDSPYSGTFNEETNHSNFVLNSVIGKRPPILQIGSVTAELKKIHLHTQSEHDFEGKNRDGEVHLIHQVNKKSDGNNANKSILVVVGVSFIATKHAAENSFIRTWASCMRSSITSPSDGQEFLIDPRRLLPKTKKWFRYEGSLTTGAGDLYPEIVSWIVMADPIGVCSADLKLLQKFAHQPERPVQDINRRFILRNFE